VRFPRGGEQNVPRGGGLVLVSMAEATPTPNHEIDLVLGVGALAVDAVGGENVDSRAHGGHAEELRVPLSGTSPFFDLGVDRVHGTLLRVASRPTKISPMYPTIYLGRASSGPAPPSEAQKSYRRGTVLPLGGRPRMSTRHRTPALLVPVAAILLFVVLLPAPTVLRSPTTSATSPIASIVPASTPTDTYSVSGTVYGLSNSTPAGAPVPIVGDLVQAVPGSGCPINGTDTGACAPVSTVTSGSSGEYTLNLASGNWLVYSSPRIGFGGDTFNVTVASASLTNVNLYSYDELRYSNSTYVLPGYDPLSLYVNNSNDDTQVPVLSYSDDGAFYVDSDSDLVFYSFATTTEQLVAPWTQLYGNVANYAGDLENAFFLTFDGTYAYELGCAASCTKYSSLEVRAVNVSTGRTFVWNVAGVTDGDTFTNVGINLIGLEGNDSIAALIQSNGKVEGYSLWNETQFYLGQLPFFEANNAYWVPFLNAYISVQADGATSDEINEAELEPAGSEFQLALVYTGQSSAAGIKSAFVDGLVFNLTLNEFSYAYGSYAKNTLAIATYSFANGIVQHEVSFRESRFAYGDPIADEHRLSVSTGAPVASSDYDPYFYNQSWAANPFADQFFDTSTSAGSVELCGVGHYAACENQFTGQGYANGPVASESFLNASYGITPYSVSCAPVGGCPLRGTTPGTVPGTIYWLAPSVGGGFPYPSSAPIDEPMVPPPLILAQQNTSTSVTVEWGVPAPLPILNYTLYWGDAPGEWSQSVNLSSSASAFTVSGLVTGQRFCYGVQAANLHGEGPTTSGCSVPGVSGDLPSASGLSATGITSSNATLNWSLPGGAALTALTLFQGLACDHWTSAWSLPPTATSYDTVGLVPLTTYCVVIQDQDADGSTNLSLPLSFVTLSAGAPAISPTGLNVTARGVGWAEVNWTNPAESLVGDQAFLATYLPGSGCGNFVLESANAQGEFTSWTYTQLVNPTTYCAAVAAVSAGGASLLSSVTYLYASSPFGLKIIGQTSSSITLNWVNIPVAAIANVTVYVGPSNCRFDDALSLGAINQTTLGGLSSASGYCITVADWIEGTPVYESYYAVPFANDTTLPGSSCSGGCEGLGASLDAVCGPLQLTCIGIAAVTIGTVILVRKSREEPPAASGSTRSYGPSGEGRGGDASVSVAASGFHTPVLAGRAFARRYW
jgi:hypothetical protein